MRLLPPPNSARSLAVVNFAFVANILRIAMLLGIGCGVFTLETLTTQFTRRASVASAADLTPVPEPKLTAYERDHWSLRPRRAAPTPDVESTALRHWARTPVDRFIAQRLESARLTPAAPAERRVLLRRVTFDLLGLPPSPDDLREFESDERPDAYERQVDRLLAHPRHGENWGQHWLDVVRYGETEGYEYDNHRPGAWRFRDYVIESLNADKPFDQFALEQLAGDEQLDATPDQQVASGFHRLGPVRRNAGNTDVAFSRNEVLTEMTDAVGAVFLGLTVGCARCHDHKFDPIRQTDYYRLQAFLAGAHEHDLQIATPAETEEWQADTKRVKAEMQKIREAMQNAEGQERDRLAEKYKKLEDTLPKPLPTISAVAHKQDQRTEIHVLHRGATEKPGQTVGPRPLGVLVDDATPELPPDVARPRTQLAQWLTSPDHPLTSRVLANRLWHFHFGAGIVATPNDFGVNGAAPSHRELLDHLANSLVAGGWRLKRLHRELVTSSVYRQASFVTDVELEKSAKQVDPDNRLLWRYSRRRLTAEQLRDSTLAVSGQLNTAFGGESVIVPVEQELVDLLYKPSQWEVTADRAQHVRRSIYLLAKRNLRVPLLEVFDQPDLQISCSRRESSTHAPQALEMLNGAFANQQADALAERLSREAGTDFERQVELGFELTTGRAPTDDERAVSVAFLRTHAPREFALALLNLNAFLYVD